MTYVGARVQLGDMRLYGRDERGCYWTVSSLDGIWDGVESTHAHSSLVWGDGWVSNRSHLGGRDITITGLVSCPDDTAYLRARQALLEAVPAAGGRMTVSVDGGTLLYLVQRAQAKPMIQPQAGLKVAKYSIPLVSLSPYAFDAGDPLSGSTGLPSSSGGLRLPAAFTGLPSSARSSWEGDAVWSSSLLDVGGVTVRNWMQDPRPKVGTRFEARWNGGLSVGADGLHVTPGSHRIGWNWTANPDHALASSPPAGAVLLPAGSYVVAWQWRLSQDTGSLATAHVESSDGGSWTANHVPAGAGVWTGFTIPVTLGSQAWLAVSDQAYDAAFGSGSSGDWRRFGIYTQADWDLMQKRGISWFDGSSLPAATGSWCFGEQVVSGAISLTNPGGAPSPVSLRVDGPVSDPRIEHEPSGGVLELRIRLGAGHYVIFDSRTRQVLVDGRDPARGAVVRRGWSDALPGPNIWRFTAGEYSPDARLSASFRGAYL